jgi:hypothetical protein
MADLLARRGRLALVVTHRQYARLFERANTAINRKLLAYLAGDWCPAHAARFARLAANRSTPTEAKDAHEHLDACPKLPHRVRDVHLASRRRRVT